MPTFEEILRSSQLTNAYRDKEWMETMRDTLMDMEDEYVVEALRLCLIISGLRLVSSELGEHTSLELAQHGLERVVDILKEIMNDGK